MQVEVVVALIGACSTVVVALIGAFITLQTQPASPGAPAPPPATRKTKRKTYAVVALAVVLGGLIMGFGYASAAKVDRQIKSCKQLVTLGLSENKSYVIPSLLMLVEIDKTADGTKIESSRHIVYQIHSLNDIHRDKPGFDEEYHSKFSIDYVPGADNEVLREDSPGMKKWNLFFDSPRGERRLIFTGADVISNNPIDRNHDLHMFHGLGPKEDAFCYPNDDGDVIGEVVIVVESKSLELFLPPGDDAILLHSDDHQRVDANLYSYGGGEHNYYTAVARFRNLQDKDVAGLKIAWR